jgi:3,4-dihydroxy 2-butanone 4-phosphate synthase/GTP cyclohydrolase II
MARLPDLEVFAERHGLKIASIAISRIQTRTEKLVRRVIETRIPTAMVRVQAYRL